MEYANIINAKATKSADALVPKMVEKAEVINSLPWDLCDDFKWRAEDRMQKGYIKDFVGTSLDDNQADNDFAAKLEILRAEEK